MSGTFIKHNGNTTRCIIGETKLANSNLQTSQNFNDSKSRSWSYSGKQHGNKRTFSFATGSERTRSENWSEARAEGYSVVAAL